MPSRSSINSESLRLLVGTYTEPEESTSEGIYVYRMDPSSGELSFESLIRDVRNASYMAVHPQSGMIYAVSETEELEGQPGGGVIAFGAHAMGHFQILHRQSSGGANPAYVSIYPQTGDLTHTGHEAQLDMPVHVLLI